MLFNDKQSDTDFSADASFEALRNQFLELSKTDSKAASEFRREHLIRPAIERCRIGFQAQCNNKLHATPKHLVVIVSHGIEVIPLLAGVMNADSCLAMYDGSRDDMAQLATEVEALIKTLLPDCGLIKKEFENGRRMKQSFQEIVTDYSIGRKSDDLVFDMTTGSQLMSYTIGYEIAGSSWLAYVHHDMIGRGIPNPGSECIAIWGGGHPFRFEQFFEELPSERWESECGK